MRVKLILGLMLLLWVPALANTQIGNLSFATNFDSLMAQAQQSQRIIIIKFYTDW